MPAITRASTTRSTTAVVDAEQRQPSDTDVTRAFSLSVAVSAVRCTLTYLVFPWLLPVVGVAGGVGPAIGLPIAVLAIGFNLASIRRFWRADHRWKVPMSTLNIGVILLLTTLVVDDLSDLWS